MLERGERSLYWRCFFPASIVVVRTSGECLRGVLATRTGGQVLGKLEEICLEEGWHLYLEPFKPQKKRKVRALCYALLCSVTLCYVWYVNGLVLLFSPMHTHHTHPHRVLLALHSPSLSHLSPPSPPLSMCRSSGCLATIHPTMTGSPSLSPPSSAVEESQTKCCCF